MVLMTLVKPITLNFQEPIVFLLNLYIALIYGLLYIWFESFPLVFTEIYGFNLGLEGVAFLGILVGTLIACTCLFSWLYFYQEKQFDENGNIELRNVSSQQWSGVSSFPSVCFGLGGHHVQIFTGSSRSSGRHFSVWRPSRCSMPCYRI